MRTFLLLGVATLVGALFARNVVVLGGETHPVVWVAAVLAALAGAFVFVLAAAHPPRFVDRLARRGRGGLLPLVAVGVAVVIVGSASTEGQLVSLALFAGFLTAASVHGLRGRVGR